MQIQYQGLEASRGSNSDNTDTGIVIDNRNSINNDNNKILRAIQWLPINR